MKTYAEIFNEVIANEGNLSLALCEKAANIYAKQFVEVSTKDIVSGAGIEKAYADYHGMYASYSHLDTWKEAIKWYKTQTE